METMKTDVRFSEASEEQQAAWASARNTIEEIYPTPAEEAGRTDENGDEYDFFGEPITSGGLSEAISSIIELEGEWLEDEQILQLQQTQTELETLFRN